MSLSDEQRTSARFYLADPGTSCVQGIQIENAVGGTYTVSYDAPTSSALAYNAGGNVVQNALCALGSVGVGNLTVNEQPDIPGSLFYAVAFAGTLANRAVPMLTVDPSALVGPGVLAVVTLPQAGGVTAFSDNELDSLFSDAGQNFWLTIAYGFDVLTNNGVKFNKYTAGQTQESKDQIYEHLKERAAFYHQRAQAARQVQIVRLRSEPPRPQAYPIPSGIPTLAISPRPRPWWRGPRWGGDW